MRYIIHSKTALLAITTAMLTACAHTPMEGSVTQRYLCELGIEFSARFLGEAVALDSTRGYDVLFRDAKPLPNPPKPHEYRNPHMSVEFQLGKNGQEAILHYPLLPLLVRCVKDR